MDHAKAHANHCSGAPEPVRDENLLLFESARAHWAAGRMAETLEACDRLVDAFTASQDWARACEGSYMRGEALRKGRQTQDAMHAFLVAHRQALRANSPMWKLRAKGGLYFTIRDLGSREAALAAQQVLLQAYKEEDHPADDMVQTLLVLVHAMRRLDLVAEIDSLFPKMQAHEGVLNPTTRAGLQREIGWLRVRQGRLVEASAAFAESHRISANLDNTLGQLECLRGLVTVELRRRDAWAAHSLLLEAGKCLDLLMTEPIKRLRQIQADPERERILKLRRELKNLRAAAAATTLPPNCFPGNRWGLA